MNSKIIAQWASLAIVCLGLVLMYQHYAFAVVVIGDGTVVIQSSDHGKTVPVKTGQKIEVHMYVRPKEADIQKWVLSKVDGKSLQKLGGVRVHVDTTPNGTVAPGATTYIATFFVVNAGKTTITMEGKSISDGQLLGTFTVTVEATGNAVAPAPEPTPTPVPPPDGKGKSKGKGPVKGNELVPPPANTGIH